MFEAFLFKSWDMNLAHALTEDYVICYRITPELSQVKLRLWEPIAPGSQHTQPFTYAANFSFRTRKEAETFLRDHLLVNGAFDVPEANFPTEGEVAILPFPTWPGEQENA